MVNSKRTTPSISFIYKKISDDKALSLFNIIAIANGERHVPLREFSKLTTKQYYTRLSGLVDAGLIRRVSGKYSLTFLGKIVYDIHLKIGKALYYYWKPKAIESIETPATSGNDF
jgi:predicted transcriptional regulator